jgi:hypothetical protein
LNSCVTVSRAGCSRTSHSTLESYDDIQSKMDRTVLDIFKVISKSSDKMIIEPAPDRRKDQVPDSAKCAQELLGNIIMNRWFKSHELMVSKFEVKQRSNDKKSKKDLQHKRIHSTVST